MNICLFSNNLRCLEQICSNESEIRVSKCLPFGMQHHKDCICHLGTRIYLVLSELISARQEIYCKKIPKPKGNVYIV